MYICCWSYLLCLISGIWNSGSSIIGTEAELEDDETEGNEKNLVDRPLQKNEIQNNEDQTAVSAHPITPLQISRFKL